MYSPKYHRFMFDGIPPHRFGGEYCKIIPLTRGRFAIVSAADYDWLMQWKWTAFDPGGGSYYAVRTQGKDRQMIYMHRLILGLEHGDPRTGDHVNSLDTLDNRRKNLRIANKSEQSCNRRMQSNNTSGYTGVSLRKKLNKFRARIVVGGKEIILGYRDVAEDAYWQLYVPAALRYHGEFASVWADVDKEIAKI